MFDLSPHITLTPDAERRYRRWQIVLIVTAALIAMAFAYALLFPETVLRYGYKNIDPVYRITEPTYDDTTITWHGALTRSVDTVTVTLVSETDLSGTELSLRRGHIAHLTHPQIVADFPDARIDDALPFAPGTLLTGSRGHAVTSLTGSRHAFDTAQTLLALGYDFARSQQTDSDTWSRYERDTLLSTRSAHPAGTIYHETDTDQTYLYTGTALTPFSPSPEQSVITVMHESRTTRATCTLTPMRFARDTYTCSVALSTLADLPGKDYLFRLRADDQTTIKQITLTFTPEVSRSNLAERITRVRELMRD